MENSIYKATRKKFFFLQNSTGYHHWQRAVQGPRGLVQTLYDRQGNKRVARDDVRLDHEMRRQHQEGLVRQHRPLGRNHHAPRYDVIIAFVYYFVRQHRPIGRNQHVSTYDVIM